MCPATYLMKLFSFTLVCVLVSREKRIKVQGSRGPLPLGGAEGWEGRKPPWLWPWSMLPRGPHGTTNIICPD